MNSRNNNHHTAKKYHHGCYGCDFLDEKHDLNQMLQRQWHQVELSYFYSSLIIDGLANKKCCLDPLVYTYGAPILRWFILTIN